MKKSKWLHLKEIDEEEKIFKSVEMDEYFLTGDSVIRQKEIKEIGQQITYYKLIKKTKNNVEYVPIYDIIEEDF